MSGTIMDKALDDLKTKNLKRIAEVIVKYQKFKTDKIMEQIIKIKSVSLGCSTLANYINYGVAYLRYGKKHQCLPTKLYDYLDEYTNNHLQPLTPTLVDKRGFSRHKYTKKEVISPIEKIAVVNAPVTEKFTYGIKIGDKIALQKSEAEAKAFLNGAKFVDNANTLDIKLVSVNWDEV